MIEITELENGLTVITENVPHVESVAYELLIPGGVLCDTEQKLGQSLMLGELIGRGAGSYDSRQYSDQFDMRGIRHSEGAGFDRYYLRGMMLTEHQDDLLGLLSITLQSPLLPEDQIEAVRSMLYQELDSLHDNPARLAMHAVSEIYYPAPYSRSPLGTKDGIANTDRQTVQNLWEKTFLPRGSVLSLAGKIDTPKLTELCRKHFKSWQGSALALPEVKAFPAHTKHHIDYDSAQLQIALAYPSAPFGDKHYYTAKVATSVLSGGMFGRLFIEIREKRGLCYSVYARHSATKDYGTMISYAGTTPERAHETLDLMLSELRRLAGTVTEEELKRAKANLKSSMIIGEESTSSRASSNVSDWFLAKKVRTLEEIEQGIERVSLKDIDAYLERFPLNSFTIVTLGSKNI